MEKVLSVRPNYQIMSLLLEIQKFLPAANRTEIINNAIENAINKNINWQEVAKYSFQIHQNIDMPALMQIKTAEQPYETLRKEILISFENVDLKRVTAPYLIKLALIHYWKVLQDEIGKNPIKEKIKEWKAYYINSPKCEYRGNEIVHDIYRALNDTDCKLTNGNLMADTMFSLWAPLKMALQCSDTYPYSQKGVKAYPYKQDNYLSKSGTVLNFLSDIESNLATYLPESEWASLYEFAALVSTRANVMLLPDRQMQTRGGKYLDQMPKTLYECFSGGEFYKFFKEDEALLQQWLHDEQLHCFFDGKLERSSIKPLIQFAEANEVYWLETKEQIDEMLHNFIELLKTRAQFYPSGFITASVAVL